MARRTIVHLGNVGEGFEGEIESKKTRDYSERFPGFDFFGIDLKELADKPTSWRQVRADFLTGLDRFPDGSVDIITSDRALGEFNRLAGTSGFEEYTKKVVEKAHAKLRPGGKLLFSVPGILVQKIRPIVEDSPFDSERMEIREFKKNEYARTYWSEYKPAVGKIFQITLQKRTKH